MKRLLTICAVAAIVLTVSGTAKAVILDVGPGQTYATITAAVGAANTAGGDTIIVHEGTYNERVYIQGFNGLTVKAADGDTVTVEGEAGKIGSVYLQLCDHRRVRCYWSSKGNLVVELSRLQDPE